MTQVFKRIPAIACLAFVVWTTQSTYASGESNVVARFPDDRNSEVMVLGTFHFANVGEHHVINIESVDVTTPKRQNEIEALVRALAKYSPTIIALEWPSEQEEYLNVLYSQYLDGSWDSSGSELLQLIERSEIFQVGFRLANVLSLDRVYAIDEMTRRPLDRMQKFSEENGFHQFLDYRRSISKEIESIENERIRSSSLGHVILELSSIETAASDHSRYVEEVRFGDRDDQPGADVFVEWYRRNVLIFQNLYSITKGKIDERILVIYGAGHVFPLRELVTSSPDFHLIEVAQFLSEFAY